MTKLSVILPVCNEEENLTLLHEQLLNALESFQGRYEIIFVDDGSTDKSLEVMKRLGANNPCVKTLSFKKNFGQTAAIAAGFKRAQGDILVTLDADLQNPPEEIPKLMEKMNEGWDVVSGIRRNRKDPLLTRKIPSLLANKLISWVTGVHLHDYGCTLKAYRSGIAKNIKLYGEMHRFLPALAAWQGARICEVDVEHRPRLHGKSKYNASRTLKVLLDLLTVKFLGSFSTKPLYFFGLLGALLMACAFVTAGYLVYGKIAHGHYIIQSPLLLLSALFVILGMQVTLMGLLAELLVRIYYESQDKATYVIRETFNLPEIKG